MSCGSCLEIVFHMINGLELKFKEADETKAEKILTGVMPNKFYAEKQISLSSETSTTRARPDSICFIQFNTSLPIEWKFITHIKNIAVLPGDKFHKAIETELGSIGTYNDPGEKQPPTSLFMELMMADGTIWNLRISVDSLKPVNKGELFAAIRKLSGFHAVRPEGGTVLINMNNVISWTTYPTALLDIKNTWKIEKS